MGRVPFLVCALKKIAPLCNSDQDWYIFNATKLHTTWLGQQNFVGIIQISQNALQFKKTYRSVKLSLLLHIITMKSSDFHCVYIKKVKLCRKFIKQDYLTENERFTCLILLFPPWKWLSSVFLIKNRSVITRIWKEIITARWKGFQISSTSIFAIYKSTESCLKLENHADDKLLSNTSISLPPHSPAALFGMPSIKVTRC